MSRRIYVSVCLGCICLIGESVLFSLHAQTEADSLRQHQLDEVVVTADRLIKEVIPVQQLSGEQLQRLGSHSVADAIRYFSGVQIKDYGGVGGLKTVNIRSMGTNHVGVFYDGIELGNAQNGTVDLGRFSLDNMEAITLYNGQKSAIFQPAKDFGSAGSIYLQSRVPKFDEDERQKVKATFKTGSFGVANPALVWDRKLSEKVSASVSGEYLYTTGRYKFTYRVDESYDTTAVRRNGDVNALRLEGGLFGNMKDGYWRAKGYFYRSERGYPGAVVSVGPLVPPALTVTQDEESRALTFTMSTMDAGFYCNEDDTVHVAILSTGKRMRLLTKELGGRGDGGMTTVNVPTYMDGELHVYAYTLTADGKTASDSLYLPLA